MDFKKIAIIVIAGGAVLAGSSFHFYKKSEEARFQHVYQTINNHFESKWFLESAERYIVSGSMDFTLSAKTVADSLTDTLNKNDKRIALVKDFQVNDFFKDQNVSSPYISSIEYTMVSKPESDCVVNGVNVCFDNSMARPTSKAAKEINKALDQMGYKIVATNKK